MAEPNSTKYDRTKQHKIWQNQTAQNMAESNSTKYGTTKQHKTWQNQTTQNVTEQNSTKYGTTMAQPKKRHLGLILQLS